jgi:HPt (histidine-containing phosphotransfer) domain-containing protein
MMNSIQDDIQDKSVVRPDPDLMDLIPSFLQHRRDEILDVESALSKRDFELIRRTAHTWKGICRPYGFLYLEKLSLRLEEAGRSENLDDAKAVAKEIQSHLATVKVVAP